jgi:hypothetical protein
MCVCVCGVINIYIYRKKVFKSHIQNYVGISPIHDLHEESWNLTGWRSHWKTIFLVGPHIYVDLHFQTNNIGLPRYSKQHSLQNQQGVCHIVALSFTLKSILRQREEWWKLKYFTMQKYNLQKTNPLKETKKNLQDIITIL